MQYALRYDPAKACWLILAATNGTREVVWTGTSGEEGMARLWSLQVGESWKGDQSAQDGPETEPKKNV